MTKLSKTLYNWSRSETPLKHPWQKRIFGEDPIEKPTEDKTAPSQEDVAKPHKASVADIDSSPCGSKRTATTAEKVKFFVSTADLKITITVSAKPTALFGKVMEVIRRQSLQTRP